MVNKKLFSLASIAIALLLIPSASAVGAATPTPTITPTVSATPLPSQTATPSVTITVTPTASVPLTPTPTELPSQNTPLAISTVLQVNTQYPWNKQIPVEIQLTPRLDGQKLEITWPTKSGYIISPKKITLSNVKKDQTYKVNFMFDPIAIGPQRVSASITLVTFEKNHITTIPVELTLDAEKIVQPIPEQYRTYETGMYVAIGVVLFVVIPLIIFAIIFYIKNKLVPKWIQSRLNEPI
jgi:hypothetical protein